MPRPQSRANETTVIGGDDDRTVSKELAMANEVMGLDEMLRVIRGIDEYTVVSDDEIQADIIERMLRAKTWEELTTPQEVTHAEEVLGKKLTFHSARLMSSDIGEGPGVYMIIDAHDGENKLLLSCGSSNVMTILAIAMHREWLPADGVIVRSDKTTKSGYKPMNLLWAPPDDEQF
jgi:hypothetical protein